MSREIILNDGVTPLGKISLYMNRMSLCPHAISIAKAIMQREGKVLIADLPEGIPDRLFEAPEELDLALWVMAATVPNRTLLQVDV